MCHELSHYLQLEQQKRIDLGLPHTDLADILNDWGVKMGQQLGYPPPGQHRLAAGTQEAIIHPHPGLDPMKETVNKICLDAWLGVGKRPK